MRIGYPCINTSLGCTSNQTFRISNYSPSKMREKIRGNLNCLKRIISFNIEKKLLFFRIGSGLIPFASHPVNSVNWEKEFKNEFKKIGKIIKENKMRISMHPDQFVVLNSLSESVVKNSLREIEYHISVLNLLELEHDAKVQIHLGGIYKNKIKAKESFYDNMKKLSSLKRLVLENDDRRYSLKDCLSFGQPVLFDNLHHACLNNKETQREALLTANQTWQKEDGPLMVDYSCQKPQSRLGQHADSINKKDFLLFLQDARGIEMDLMLEIKDKEKSALIAKDLFHQYAKKMRQ